MPIFSQNVEHQANQKEIWNWHNSPGAFRRIMPEWEAITPINAGALRDGEETIFKVSLGPIKKKWIARHHDVIEGESFFDRMIKGPFSAWDHQHKFIPGKDAVTTVSDNVEYKLPFHTLTGWSAGLTVLPRLRQMFYFRSTRLTNDLIRIQATSDKPRQKVVVSGSSGMIGLQLCAFLEAAGHDVYRLIRKSTKLPPDVNLNKVIRWDDLSGEIFEGEINGFDTVIHLAGAGIADKRWSKKRKKMICDSRVVSTENLSKLLASIQKPPRRLLCASSIGIYGNRGDEVLDEQSKPGNDFLSDICLKWENASERAKDAGINVVHLRTGIVISPLGGALAKLLLPAKLGSAGPIRGGQQIQSWISLDDQIYGIHHLMMTDSSEGLYNLTSPNPVSQKQFAKVLGKVLRRPAFIPLPGFFIRIIFGEMGKKLVLEGQDVRPNRLLESGYEFTYTDLETCLRNCLGRVDLTNKS